MSYLFDSHNSKKGCHTVRILFLAKNEFSISFNSLTSCVASDALRPSSAIQPTLLSIRIPPCDAKMMPTIVMQRIW